MKRVKKTAARRLAKRAVMRENTKMETEKAMKRRMGTPVRTTCVTRNA
jgi:hypothetical protein